MPGSAEVTAAVSQSPGRQRDTTVPLTGVSRSTRNADLVARVTVTEMYGDFRRSGAPAAVLALRVTVVRLGARAAEPLLSKGYSRSVSIPARRPADLAAGIDRAVTEIAAGIVADLRTSAIAP